MRGTEAEDMGATGAKREKKNKRETMSDRERERE